MTEFTATPDRTRVLLSKRVDGALVGQDKIDPTSLPQRRRAARSLGCDEADILRWADAARTGQETYRYVLPEAAPERPAFVTRPLTDTRENGARHEVSVDEFLNTVLPKLPVEHVAEWASNEALCCLDVDYHDCPAPPRDWLETVVYTKVHPTPRAWHFSRGGGLHLFYAAADPFTAHELAAIAALRVKLIDPSAGVELKRVVRGPGKEPVVNNGSQTTASAMSASLGVDETDPDERDGWLAANQMDLGKRYDHTRCPVRPTPGHASKGEPVTVNEDGIFCHNCAGQGRALRRGLPPGYAPWAAVLGNPSGSDVGSMIRGLCHWGHAKYVLRYKYGFPEALGRVAYRAACKAYHRDTDAEPLVGLVDGSADTEEFTRVGPVWLSIPQAYTYPADRIAEHLKTLPACLRHDGEKVQVVKATVEEFTAGKSLADRGFPDVEVVHGFRLAGPYLPPPARAVVPVPHADLRAAGRVPVYQYRSRRMPEDRAWSVIEGIFPDVDRVLVRASIAAFGCSQETQKGQNPILFVHGISGAAKTSTIRLAAGIFGSHVAEPSFNPDDTRFRANLWAGAQSGPGVVINELLKDAGRHRLTSRQALDPLLTVTSDAVIHKHYHGPIKFGRVPAIFVTDIVVPAHVVEDTQLARRLRGRAVDRRKDAWKDTVPAAGLSFGELYRLRLVSQEVNAACDAILSEVVDEFFAVPMTWDKIADALGVRTLEDSEDFEDPRPRMAEFFDLVCKAPPIENARLARQYAGGYKEISRERTTELAQELAAAYTTFADNGNWWDSRQLTAADWSTILKSDQVVKLDLRTDGTSVFARFRVGPLKNPIQVNEAIKCNRPKPSTP